MGDRGFREISCGPRHTLALLEPVEEEDKAWLALQLEWDREENPVSHLQSSDSDSD